LTKVEQVPLTRDIRENSGKILLKAKE